MAEEELEEIKRKEVSLLLLPSTLINCRLLIYGRLIQKNPS